MPIKKNEIYVLMENLDWQFLGPERWLLLGVYGSVEQASRHVPDHWRMRTAATYKHTNYHVVRIYDHGEIRLYKQVELE